MVFLKDYHEIKLNKSTKKKNKNEKLKLFKIRNCRYNVIIRSNWKLIKLEA